MTPSMERLFGLRDGDPTQAADFIAARTVTELLRALTRR